ncbi:MAG: hypothetical protein IJ523_07625 [Succinivibrionaceae bacterium]|nr:hypothetical protein [Succinivibrionaceae bacterium]
MDQISAAWQTRLLAGYKTLILPLLCYYGSGRRWDYTRQEKRTDLFTDNARTLGYRDSLSGAASVGLMMNWFRKVAADADENGERNEQPGIVAAVCQAMERVFMLASGYREAKIRYSPEDYELICRCRDETGRLVAAPVSLLSDGYRGIVSLIADMACKMAILNPQLGENVIRNTHVVVLIDEAELHLHPAAQHIILPALREIFPNIQFVATTNAPAIIGSVKRENLALLSRGQAVEASVQSFGSDANSILRDIMGADERHHAMAKMFRQFYETLAANNHDEAERILDEIDMWRYFHDAEAAGCRVKLRLERIRTGRNGQNVQGKSGSETAKQSDC